MHSENARIRGGESGGFQISGLTCIYKAMESAEEK